MLKSELRVIGQLGFESKMKLGIEWGWMGVGIDVEEWEWNCEIKNSENWGKVKLGFCISLCFTLYLGVKQRKVFFWTY